MDHKHLLKELQNLQRMNDQLQAFCEFPHDLKFKKVQPNHMGACALFTKETDLFGKACAQFNSLLHAVAPVAYWRDTYAGTNISDDFKKIFGCYCLIGVNDFFQSDRMHSYMVYMPAGLCYPWHQNPAEELYLCLAGEAVFKKDLEEDTVLREGEITIHGSSQPHATQTRDRPVLCYVFWRNKLTTEPVLTFENASKAPTQRSSFLKNKDSNDKGKEITQVLPSVTQALEYCLIFHLNLSDINQMALLNLSKALGRF